MDRATEKWRYTIDPAEIKDLADLARQIAEAKDPVQQAELQRE